MCYTAFPGQTGEIRVVRDMSTPKKEQFTKPAAVVPRAGIPTRAAATLMESMSHEFAAGRGDSRRDRQNSNEKGKRLAKRLHKPNWRDYEKY